jgi:hypothetical protein
MVVSVTQNACTLTPPVHDVFQRHQVHQAQRHIDVRRDRAQARHECVGVAPDVDGDVERIPRRADERMIDPRGSPSGVDADIGRDTDDLEPGLRLEIPHVPETPADRIPSTHHAIDECLVDDGDSCVGSRLAGVEPAPRQHRYAEHVEILRIDVRRWFSLAAKENNDGAAAQVSTDRWFARLAGRPQRMTSTVASASRN